MLKNGCGKAPYNVKPIQKENHLKALCRLLVYVIQNDSHFIIYFPFILYQNNPGASGRPQRLCIS